VLANRRLFIRLFCAAGLVILAVRPATMTARPATRESAGIVVKRNSHEPRHGDQGEEPTREPVRSRDGQDHEAGRAGTAG